MTKTAATIVKPPLVANFDRVIRGLNHYLIPASSRTWRQPRLAYSFPASPIQTVGQLYLNDIRHFVKNIKKSDPGVANPELDHSIEGIIEVIFTARANNQDRLIPVN